LSRSARFICSWPTIAENGNVNSKGIAMSLASHARVKTFDAGQRLRWFASQ
jgi:hypothetical protein